MRIWSLHPQYLDAKGLVALWRETLLAKKVLEGKSSGYKNHPQLYRFKESSHALQNINIYLQYVHQEATRRSYHFDINKFKHFQLELKLPVTQGQINYEFKHLLNKLSIRDTERFEALRHEELILPHPLFDIVEGEIEDWEIISPEAN